MLELSDQFWTVISLSMQVSLVAMIFTVPFAIFVAYLLARKRFPGWHIFNAICHLPLVMPPVITGYLLLLAFRPRGFLGSFLETIGLSVAFQWSGAAIAAGVMAFPLVMRPIRLAFENQDKSLLETAKTLGASRFKAFVTISLPLAVPGILAGGILGFAKALGEFGATITFVSNIPGETQTLALAVYSLLQTPSGDTEAFFLILAGIAISFIAIIASEILAQRLSGKREQGDA